MIDRRSSSTISIHSSSTYKEYEKVKYLGQGGYGDVFKCISKLTKKYCAMKIVSICEIVNTQAPKLLAVTQFSVNLCSTNSKNEDNRIFVTICSAK